MRTGPKPAGPAQIFLPTLVLIGLFSRHEMRTKLFTTISLKKKNVYYKLLEKIKKGPYEQNDMFFFFGR